MVAEQHNESHHNQEVTFFFDIYWFATKQRDLQGLCVGVRVLFYESLCTCFWGFFFFFTLSLSQAAEGHCGLRHRLCLWKRYVTLGDGSLIQRAQPLRHRLRLQKTVSKKTLKNVKSNEVRREGCETKSVVNNCLLLFTLLHPFSIL